MLSIITVSYNDENGLSRTIESVLRQKFVMSEYSFEQVVIASGMSKTACEKFERDYKRDNIRYIFNQDSGIYNAMNIGIENALGTHLLFLNGGDIFNSNDSIQAIQKNLKLDIVSAFRVIQTVNNIGFIRPGSKRAPIWEKFSHQGFVVPNTEDTPKYSESRLISADTAWMRTCCNRFSVECSDTVICDFSLGGVSNSPSLKTIYLRWRSDGLFQAFLEAIKLVVHRVVGEQRYYKFLAKRAGYIQISLDRSSG